MFIVLDDYNEVSEFDNLADVTDFIHSVVIDDERDTQRFRVFEATELKVNVLRTAVVSIK